METKDYYVTSDTNFTATILSLGGKVDATYVDEKTGRYTFYFEDGDEIKELVRKYYNRELLVEPLELFNARKDLLSRIKNEAAAKNPSFL